jgi:hypothetical protein
MKLGSKQGEEDHRRKLILPNSMIVNTHILSSPVLSSISEQTIFLS